MSDSFYCSKVSYVDLVGIMVIIANVGLGKTWSKESGKDSDEKTEKKESDHKDPQSDKQRVSPDLTFVFPSQRCVSMQMEDVSLLNFKCVSECLINKDYSVVAVGLHGKAKAEDHRLYDIKADHIT